MVVHSTFLYIVALGSGVASVIASNTGGLVSRQLTEVCQRIASSTSTASQVYDIFSLNYETDIYHWASSSTQLAACTLEPGTAEDVSVALRILGQSQAPFAVKGGGHTANPGFSSTPGVQIAMARFSEISYDASAQTVTLGAGLIWDDVYAALEPYGVNVVGGRVTGVGVAGFTLGGGYSWLTNQYGLTIDTVQAFELVLPNGTVTDVTATSSPDLFFALRGGLNNFGIVTKFTLKTFPQTPVWGGLIIFDEAVFSQVNQATANFTQNNADPKGLVITSYNYFLAQPLIFQLLFYDAPSPPEGMFDAFLKLPSLSSNVYSRSFLDLVRSYPINITSGTRATFNTVSVMDYPVSLLEAVVNETKYWGQKLALGLEVLISYEIEPFMPSLYSHSTSPSAYPPSRAAGYSPLSIYYAWLSPFSDQDFQNAIRTTASTLKTKAIVEGQDVTNAARYPNYAIYDTPVSDLYGANLPRLQAIKAAVDPDNVMGLAGGFKITAPNN